MAYSKDVKRYNFGLSQDDNDRFLGVKAFLGLTSDADVFRYCLRETYLQLCHDDSKVDYIENAINLINDLKIELLALIRE